MSAEGQVAEVTPTDEGPREIFVVGQEAPKAEEPKEPAAVAAPAAKVAGSEEQVADDRDEKGRYKPGLQTRIDELTRARREAEREAEYWKTRVQTTTPQASAKAAQEGQPPVRAGYESDEAFLDALTDYKVDQRMAQREQQQKQQQEQTTKATTWESKLEKARTEIEGFETVMATADAPVAKHVAELIMEHDLGPHVMHHLAINQADLDKINAMSPAKAAFEIAKIASKFDVPPAASSSQSAAAASVVSKAPPPAARNVGSGRSTETALGDLPMEDYIAKRTSQGASWAR